MEQYGWAIGVGIIIIALSLSKAVPGPVRAFADRIAERTATPPAGGIASPAPHVLDDLQRRVAELEGGVAFAQRLLAKQREGERPPTPSSCRPHPVIRSPLRPPP